MAASAPPCDAAAILPEVAPPVLELQRLDEKAAALRLRLEAHPARAALAAGRTEQERIEAARSAAQERRRALEDEERVLAAKGTEIGASLSETEKLLYSGIVRAPKELLGLQQELDLHKARRRQLEEEEFGLLERSETIARELAELGERTASLQQEIGVLQTTLDTAAAETDGELRRLAGLREAVTPTVPASLLAAYEKLRAEARLGSLVTAHFDGQTCRGCNTTLPIVAATKILREPETAVVQCPRCRRLLIR